MYKKQYMFYASFLVLFSAFFFGCNQDKFDAGIDLVPDSLRLNSSAIDTFSVKGYTYDYTNDSVLTSGASKVLVGSYTDPVFGEVRASFVTQLLLSTSTTENSNVTKEDVVTDSLVLYFRYPTSGMTNYGDSLADLTIDIMKINKFLNFSDKFYHFDTPDDLMPEQIRSFTFNPTKIIDDAEFFVDSVYQAEIDSIVDATEEGQVPDTANVEKSTPLALVSVKLPNTLMDEIYNQLDPSINGTTTFVEQFNGFYFRPNAGASNGGISIFNYIDSETKAVLYYRIDTVDYKYNFGLNSSASRYNIFEHDYTTGDILADLNNPESQEDTVMYIQGLGGLKTKIEFPYLNSIINQGLWAVNKAELIFPVESGTIKDFFPAPNSLIVKGIHANGHDFFLDEYLFYDQSNGTTSYLGTSYNENEYKFNITVYMQKVFKGEHENNGLFLSIPDEATNPSRVVLKNGNLDSDKIKLKLTLTKLFN